MLDCLCYMASAPFLLSDTFPFNSCIHKQKSEVEVSDIDVLKWLFLEFYRKLDPNRGYSVLNRWMPWDFKISLLAKKEKEKQIRYAEYTIYFGHVAKLHGKKEGNNK